MSSSRDIYYVVLRSTGWQPIFKGDDDYEHFAAVVGEAAAACQATVHAYCLLPAEARLAVQVGNVTVNQFAQRIADEYARRLEREICVNRARLEQKYRGVLVNGQSALLDLVRHIHLAPLKAGLADDLMEYPWCSHRVYMGAEYNPWLTTAATLEHFEKSGHDPRRGYVSFMSRGVEEMGATGPVHAAGLGVG